MKFFRTASPAIVKECQLYFDFCAYSITD